MNSTNKNMHIKYPAICLAVLISIGMFVTSGKSVQITLRSSAAEVRVGDSFGGSIVWLSTYSATNGSGPNLVNTHDHGRLIQQSYYSGNSIAVIDQTPSTDVMGDQREPWQPWPWNPIQAGSRRNLGSTLLEFRQSNGVIYTQCTPKLWDRANLDAQARIEQQIQFEPNMPQVIRVFNKFVSFRNSNDAWGGSVSNPQELPAAYFDRDLFVFKRYVGNDVWEICDSTPPPNKPWGVIDRNLMGQKAAGAFFSSTDFGVAIYSPKATSEWFIGTRNSAPAAPTDFATSYLGPMVNIAFSRSTTYTYRYWIILGTAQTIADRIDQLRVLYPNG